MYARFEPIPNTDLEGEEESEYEEQDLLKTIIRICVTKYTHWRATQVSNSLQVTYNKLKFPARGGYDLK